jgi:hypothetical protein
MADENQTDISKAADATSDLATASKLHSEAIAAHRAALDALRADLDAFKQGAATTGNLARRVATSEALIGRLFRYLDPTQTASGLYPKDETGEHIDPLSEV